MSEDERKKGKVKRGKGIGKMRRAWWRWASQW
jgi:hypothetical protein